MNFDDIPFDETYDNCTFVIYPAIKYNKKDQQNGEMFGSIISSDSEWKTISEKLSGSKSSVSDAKVYIYRDLEYHISNSNTSVIHKKTVYANIHENYLLKIENQEILDDNAFPKLNVYHDEYEKKTVTYKFGTIDLNLITKTTKDSKQYKYIEITFHYKNNQKATIIKDLASIKL